MLIFPKKIFSLNNCVKMDAPRLVGGEYHDSCQSVIEEIATNGKLLLTIPENGLQMLSAEDRDCFWDNIQKMTEVMFRMHQFLSDFNFPERG